MQYNNNRTSKKLRKKYANKAFKKQKGKLLPIDLNDSPEWMTRAYRNNRYTVMIDDKAAMTTGVIAVKAMIQRHDDKPIPNHWREIQDIKNELFGKETVGIEFYPKESELLDDHNIYWLWILPEDLIPRYLKQCCGSFGQSRIRNE